MNTDMLRTTSNALFAHNEVYSESESEEDDSHGAAATTAIFTSDSLESFHQMLRPNSEKFKNLGYSHLTTGTNLCRSERKYDEDDDVQDLHDEKQEERPEQRNFHGLWTHFTELHHDLSDSDRSQNELLCLVQYFARVCVIRINELEERHVDRLDSDDRANMEWLKSERNTWWLLESLLGLEARRVDEDFTLPNNTFVPTPDAVDNLNINPSALRYGEDFLAVRDLRTMRQSSEGDVTDQYRKCQTVVEWFEKCTQENEKIRRLETLEEVKEAHLCGLRGTFISVDPERIAHVADPDHTSFDRDSSTRLLYVWKALRAGRRDIAEELCRENGEIWRAESIQGSDVGRLNAESGWIGNPQRFMWKKVAFAMSNASDASDAAVDGGISGTGQQQLSVNSPTLSTFTDATKYERAVYAKLCGNYKGLKKTNVCTTWEDRCWSVFSSMCERLIDNEILARRDGNLQGTENYHGGGGLEYLTGPPSKSCAEEVLAMTDDVQKMLEEKNWEKAIFERIQAMPNSWEAGIQNSDSRNAQAFHRRVQAALIKGHTRTLFEDLTLLRPDNEAASSQFPAELNRFSCHLALCYKFMASYTPSMQNLDLLSPQENDLLIERYLKYFMQRQQYSLVATYCVSLTKEARINQYANMLTTIMDHERRSMCVKLAIRHFGPEEALEVVDRAVDRIVSDSKVLHVALAFLKTQTGYLQLVNVMKDQELFAQSGLVSGSGDGRVRLNIEHFYRVWSLFMLFQDLPVDLATSDFDSMRGDDDDSMMPYHDGIWSRWHKQALVHCNSLANRLMISDYQRMVSIEQKNEHLPANAMESTELVGLSPSIDLLLNGLPTASVYGGGSSEFSAVRPILLVDATVVHGNDGVGRSRIDLVETLINEQVINDTDRIVGEHQILRSIADAARQYTNWFKVCNALKVRQTTSEDATATLRTHNQDASIRMKRVLQACGNEETPILPELRKVMVPRMARDLVRMHTDTGQWFMDQGLCQEASLYFSKAMQVSDLVAANDQGQGGLYQCFHAADMDQFLDQVRLAGIALLESGTKSRARHDLTHRVRIRSGGD